MPDMVVVFSFESSGGKAFRDGRERLQSVESGHTQG
jgi:hypothetical protein